MRLSVQTPVLPPQKKKRKGKKEELVTKNGLSFDNILCNFKENIKREKHGGTHILLF
jgi:hypothetical protein